MVFLGEFERLIAWRYIRSRRKERFVSIITLFSLLGVMLGVATLIVVTSLMNGIREEMTSRFVGIGGHITIESRSGGISDYAPLLEQVQKAEGIESAIAKIEGQVMANANGRALGAQALAYPAASFQARSLLPEATNATSLTALKNGEGVILGERLARSLGVKIGESVSLISPKGHATFAGTIPKIKSFKVVGTFKLGMYLYDSSLVWMPFEEAQTYFSYKNESKDTVASLEMTLKDPEKAVAIAAKLAESFGSSFWVSDWQRSNGSVFSALKVQQNVMVIILSLIIIVAAFNIVSSLIMLVQDKSPAIAIMRTMGATRQQIIRIFCAIGSFVGLTGTVLGLALGLVVADNLEAIRQGIEALTGQEILVEEIYFLSSLPTKTDMSDVIIIIFGAIVLSFLVTLYPARRAASLDPVEALRYE